ncbi:hypothetical protein PybrP1_012864 [[Pythium] brassicae (nom. inval.)]|nr:hypothetical protein PybrP1_012864 [[Pythium] brassicae (nom. inval.)]
MLSKGLALMCKWCLGHLIHAATKGALGIDPRLSSRNPDMTKLINNVRATVRVVKVLEDKNWKTKLLYYQAHRFIGLARVVARVIEEWGPHETWFEECYRSAGVLKVLEQFYALLHSVAALHATSQAETRTQLYHLRVVALNSKEPLKGCCATSENEAKIATTDLDALNATTRQKLEDGQFLLPGARHNGCCGDKDCETCEAQSPGSRSRYDGEDRSEQNTAESSAATSVTEGSGFVDDIVPFFGGAVDTPNPVDVSEGQF